ncbi:hypothetical protein OE88DRAFT_1660950, partial [Heliocybe sulcata]
MRARDRSASPPRRPPPSAVPSSSVPPLDQPFSTYIQTQGPSQAPPPVPIDPPLPSEVRQPPTGPSHHDVSRLTREFWENRRQITAARARLPVLLEELKKLGAPVLPDLQSAADSERLDLNDLATMEATFRQEASLRRAAEARLAEEQTRRAAVEQVLSEVERECREPFVVPALLTAFLEIAKMTEEAIPKGPAS